MIDPHFIKVLFQGFSDEQGNIFIFDDGKFFMYYNGVWFEINQDFAYS